MRKYKQININKSRVNVSMFAFYPNSISNAVRTGISLFTYLFSALYVSFVWFAMVLFVAANLAIHVQFSFLVFFKDQ